MTKRLKNGYFIYTFGCQMNERDSESLAGFLTQMGYEKVLQPEEAAVILINTCCVRESAEQKILGRLGELNKHKKADPEVIIGIGGCMVQQPGMSDKIRTSYRHVDLVFGTHNLHQLPIMIERCRQSQERIIDVWDSEGEIIEELPERSVEGIKAHVTIMYGCDNYCSYCIVPYVRGRERSRQPKDIVAEVESLVKQGVREVTLLGQNVNSYGKDLQPPISFGTLLQEVNKIDKLERIRFTTSHPKDFDPTLIEAMTKAPKVCEQIHLPVQAGSNAVLEAMNRGYNRAYYLDLISKIRQALPNVALTTDLIIGFPGETEEDFADTLDLLEKVRFDNAFTFLYSRRSGTPAAEMENQISDETKRERFQKLLKLQNKISLEQNEPLVGQVLEVLVEGPSKTNPDKLTGRTRGNKIVVFDGQEDSIGQIVSVKIEEVRTWTLLGNLEDTRP
ncbi:tRNA (N6-isopentenyl adenosine(37)-C2)-methylthiotransferase MiaB [Heliorestis acidaminivorans]|uniref:tRNA-2-methylthio-N(6)-dimethylallyladenosine synthase n=1 Tax=Heliorestis acidaminivorans TaxID=553427 RepID=A0A6I0EZW0_9FIRM|nr:tRNA (N6-isopentenyl adenosine(37)-C2)-methylthiotransferase MiaB [Heliorestis acidaminivorans]KAB2954206.1 tRNA (N6-isopentenyl adenosine(37)-C2)-methylthiotransferase MiaB [Heliorestis acidaminivorans]